MTHRGLINGFWLKGIMAFFMVLDHVYYFFHPHFPIWFTILGRLVAPVFAYLMTQGLIHTRNPSKYVGRLFGWGLGMLAVNTVLSRVFKEPIPMDIFLSLAVSAAIILTIEQMRKNGVHALDVVKFLLLLVSTLLVEGLFLLPVICLVFYYLRHNRLLMAAVYVLVSVALCSILMGFGSIQLWMVAAIIPILLYNGQRGASGIFSKYFFYVFYPLHVYILYFIYLGWQQLI